MRKSAFTKFDLIQSWILLPIYNSLNSFWCQCHYRSSRPEGFFKKRILFLIISQNSQENTCWSFFLINFQALGLYFIKTGLKDRCSPVNFAKFFEIPIFLNFCEWLLPSFYGCFCPIVTAHWFFIIQSPLFIYQTSIWNSKVTDENSIF